MNKKDKNFKKLLDKYNFYNESTGKIEGNFWGDDLYDYLKYLKEYEEENSKEVTLLYSSFHIEKAKEKFNIDFSKENLSTKPYFGDQINQKLLNSILELPWERFHYSPWSDLIVDDVYFSFNEFQDRVTIHATDFTISRREDCIGRSDEIKINVYFANTLILSDRGRSRKGEQAFYHPTKSRFGACNRYVVNSCHAVRSIQYLRHFPTHYSLLKDIYKVKSDYSNKEYKIIKKYIGYPRKGNFVSTSQDGYLKESIHKSYYVSKKEERGR